MHTSSSGRSYVPYGTGNPTDFYGPRKQSLPLHISASHIIRPTYIGTSRLSSATPSPHLSGLRLRDSSDSDAQTSTPPLTQHYVLPRVASTSGSVPPPPSVDDDTDADLIGLVPGDTDRLGRVFMEPDGSS